MALGPKRGSLYQKAELSEQRPHELQVFERFEPVNQSAKGAGTLALSEGFNRHSVDATLGEDVMQGKKRERLAGEPLCRAGSAASR